MKTRFRISLPPMDAWVQAFLMTGAIAMAVLIVSCPDVMSLVT